MNHERFQFIVPKLNLSYSHTLKEIDMFLNPDNLIDADRYNDRPYSLAPLEQDFDHRSLTSIDDRDNLDVQPVLKRILQGSPAFAIHCYGQKSALYIAASILIHQRLETIPDVHVICFGSSLYVFFPTDPLYDDLDLMRLDGFIFHQHD